MTSYFPILAGTFEAMTKRCQFSGKREAVSQHLPRSLETSEREMERAPGRGLFCYESLGSATDGGRCSANSAARTAFCLSSQITRVLHHGFVGFVARRGLGN